MTPAAVRIGSILPLSTVDYPEKLSCVVFFQGCPFRCPFCYNSDLVLNPRGGEAVDARKLALRLVKDYSHIVDAVVLSGGEPLMQYEGVKEFLKRLRKLKKSLLIKLDTNGFYPEALGELLSLGLVDYVAIDVKSDEEGYGRIIGNKSLGRTAWLNVKKSIMIAGGYRNVLLETRTTVVPGGFNDRKEIMEGIAEVIGPSSFHTIQAFEAAEGVIDKPLMGKKRSPSNSLLERLARITVKVVPTRVRTVDGNVFFVVEKQ